ncbi:hypothetical protein ACFUC1_08030 [Pedococcus sp. NPDC057267]|uniref:hypothetical protein n=1 Tax=Pedococcus sp. NPDC057267 TaxID=3346077 RepID=UPI003645200A
MIRNLVLIRMAPDAADADWALLRAGLDGVASLRMPGQVSVHVGLDLGLRAGGWSAAISNDWADADAYRAYDVDHEHIRYRAMIVQAAAEVARVQLSIDG